MVGRYRTTLGPRFTEGARLLWSVLEAGEWTLPALAEAAKMSRASLFRCLYGDREMRIGKAGEIEKLTGIPVSAWSQKISEPFEPSRAAAPESSPEIVAGDATGTEG